MAGLLDGLFRLPTRLGQQFVGGLLDAASLPGDVYSGSQPVTDDSGNTSQSLINRAANLGGMVTGGTYALAPAESGAVGMGIRAYHGSPYDFDKFDLSKIGTGEGAQAYGHGLYFAESPSVAKTYQAKVPAMNGTGTPFVEGRPINWDSPSETAAFELARHNGDRAAAADFYERTFKSGSEVPSILRSGRDLPTVDFPGRMYEVNINAEPQQFLDWDKPLSQQPGTHSAIANAQLWPGATPQDIAALDVTGQDAYHRAVAAINGGPIFPGKSPTGAPQVSDALNSAGIPGIRYLDQGSRGAGQGSSNYVVFDPKLIDILKKYGIAGLGAGSALYGAAQDQQQ